MSWKRYEVDAVSLRVKGKTRRDKTRQVGAQDRRNSHRRHKTRQAKTAQAIRQNQDRTRQRQQRQLSQVTRLDETNQDTTRQTQNEPRQDKDPLPSLFLFYLFTHFVLLCFIFEKKGLRLNSNKKGGAG